MMSDTWDAAGLFSFSFSFPFPSARLPPPAVFPPACAVLSVMAGGFAGPETYTCSPTARRRRHMNAGLSIESANEARSRKETLRDDTQYGERKKTPQIAGKRPYSRFHPDRYKPAGVKRQIKPTDKRNLLATIRNTPRGKKVPEIAGKTARYPSSALFPCW